MKKICLALLAGWLCCTAPDLHAQSQKEMENDLLDLPEMEGLGVMLVSQPGTDEPYYTYKGIEPLGDHVTTLYWFHVYTQPKYEIKIYDVVTDRELSLEEWRKFRKEEEAAEAEMLLEELPVAERQLFQLYVSHELGYTIKVEQGRVRIHFDRSEWEKNAYIQRRFGGKLIQEDFEVLGLSAPCTGVFVADIGQDTNPIICLLLNNGKVEMLSLFDFLKHPNGIGTLSSGVLPGIEDIVAFEANGGGLYHNEGEVRCTYVTIYAIDGKGKRHEISPFTASGEAEYIAPDGARYALTLTQDWKIKLTAVGQSGKELSLVGRFHEQVPTMDYAHYDLAYSVLNREEISDQNAALSQIFGKEGQFRLHTGNGNNWEIRMVDSPSLPNNELFTMKRR